MQTYRDTKIFKSNLFPFPEEMTFLFDGTSARGGDKWAPIMDGMPKGILTDMDSRFFFFFLTWMVMMTPHPRT